MKRNAPENAWNAQTPEQAPWNEPDYTPDQLPERQSGGSARLLPLAVCAVLLVVLLVEGAFFWLKGRQLAWQNAVYVPDAQQSMHQADESFAFGPYQRAVKVSGQGEDLGPITGIAQGEKIVRAAVSLGAMNQAAWDCDGAFYLQCDGVYYRNLGGYELEEEHPEWAMRALEGFELCGPGMEEGWVYFLVPESVSEGTLWLHWLEKNDDYDTESVQTAGVAVQFDQEVTGND